MVQFFNHGNGGDGAVTLSGTQTVNDTAFTGTAGATTGTGATGLTVADNSIALIIQMRGTGVGQYEQIQIASYVSGTGVFTFNSPLVYTYTDSGDSQAQLIILKQYSSVTVSGTLTAKQWDGNVGGVLAFLCSGELNVTGTITAAGKGFQGLAAGGNTDSTNGEGNAGAGHTVTTGANGSGGGGGATNISESGGGGGGNGTSGQNGANGGVGGATDGSADLTTMVMGGAGGKGGKAATGDNNRGGAGGSGGGIIFIVAKYTNISGIITADGLPGGKGIDGGGGGGGGGAGGSILIIAQSNILGTSITAVGGIGGERQSSTNITGGAGGDGRIRVQGCTLSGTTTPTASTQTGGYSFCSGTMAIL